MKEDENIRFVARHYRHGRFAVEPALRRIMPHPKSWWTPVRVAAACAGLIALGATAGIMIHQQYLSSPRPAEERMAEPGTSVVAVVKVIDFESAPLTVVADKIKEVYGVKLGNLPEDSSTYALSLHYEGTAADLVATINEILGTEITIEKDETPRDNTLIP